LFVNIIELDMYCFSSTHLLIEHKNMFSFVCLPYQTNINEL